MNNICRLDLRSILQSVVSRFIYRDEINNMCGTNTYLNELFTEDWRYVYRICLHRQPHNYDGPAIIWMNGDQHWYKEGKHDREGDQPAIIWADGDQDWWKEGKLHREGDQPAIICANGDQYWYNEGMLHREGNQPAVTLANGRREWWNKGIRVR